MNINIKNTNIVLDSAIRDYVEKRIDAIEKFFKYDTSAQCDIELAKTTEHHKSGDIFRAEIHITAKNKNHYASAEKEDIYKAIDAVRDEMLHEVTSEKEKKISIMRRGGARIKNLIKGLWPNKKK